MLLGCRSQLVKLRRRPPRGGSFAKVLSAAMPKLTLEELERIVDSWPKAADVVGMYLSPPDNAVVLCVDEKPHIQALQWCAGDAA